MFCFMSTPSQDYRRFFTEDVQQVEMPNQLNSRGQQSNLEHILQRNQQGLKILERERYEIVSGNFVDGTGTLGKQNHAKL